MRLDLLTNVKVVLLALLAFLIDAPVNSSTITYTDPNLFQTAITNQSTTTFDTFASDTVIPNGTVVDGIAYTFNITGGFSGLATNLYEPVSGPNTLGVNRSSINPFANNFFFAGDSVTLTFSEPIRAVGAYFVSNPIAGNAPGFLSISTPLGSAVSGNPLPAGTFGFGSNILRFVGISSDQSFNTATLGISNPSPGNVGFVTDNISVGGLPKSNQEIYHLSLNALSSLNLENPISQNLGLNIMDTSLTTALTLSQPLLTQDQVIQTLKLFGLGQNIWKLFNLLYTGEIPGGPLQFFILPCPVDQLIYCVLPGESKGFSASSNEIFSFELGLEMPSDSINLFQTGDRVVLDSPIYSDQTFSVASLVGIQTSVMPGFSHVTFRIDGISVLPEQQVPEPASYILMLVGLCAFFCIACAKRLPSGTRSQ